MFFYTLKIDYNAVLSALDVMKTAFITLLVFSALIFIHEFGHFITARMCGVGVKEFAIGMGPTVFSWTSKKSGTKYGVRALPIGGFVSMVGEDEASDEENAFCNKSIPKRMLIVVAGAAMNLFLAFAIMSGIVFSQDALATTEIYDFDENAVSNEKLQAGDIILSVGGVPVFTGDDAAYEIMYQGYEPIDIKVKRNGEKLLIEDVSFHTFEEQEVNFGDYDFRFVGISRENCTPWLYLKHAFFRSLSSVKMTLDSVVSLLTGRFGLNAVSGPVGVAGAVGDAAKLGIINILYLVAVLSANLGIFNLVPFPALDGGRALLLIIEAIRRKPLKKEVEAYINFAGFAVLMVLMVVIMGKDIINLFRR